MGEEKDSKVSKDCGREVGELEVCLLKGRDIGPRGVDEHRNG